MIALTGLVTETNQAAVVFVAAAIIAPGFRAASGPSRNLPPVFEFADARVMTVSVAAADVELRRLVERRTVGIVGVVDHELHEGPEVTLDAIQPAGVGGVATRATLLVTSAAQRRMAGVQWVERLSMTMYTVVSAG